MTALPPINDVLHTSTTNQEVLSDALTILFETTPPINTIYVPKVAEKLEGAGATLSYADIIEISIEVVLSCDREFQARFIECHPRIGQVKKLSQLSSKEQASVETPPQVLARLEHLNACYEFRFPGLRYITFVNGRTRAQIMEEMEDKLRIPRSLSPQEPEVESVGKVSIGGEEWISELERAVEDIASIARARLAALGGTSS
ncbi:hypothetical protein NLI96_g10617 [Meripilus lineatus]|uniref:Oxo-4-hydroxy-4-carboxy-5-ureidoimidazoline decarboxylase domain-containing protein n=1 Tax=Meripilus lineatus TaxID=2056292 RepID=A0AAD5UUY4_9APHY|nr:hypothetical protein NLI96_g10617 [Physisporinus lineatus]